MSDALSWETESGCLMLQGELTHLTLQPLWQQRQAVMQSVSRIDVSRLGRVDSSGLALLVHLRQLVIQRNDLLQFTGVTDRLRSLMGLYNLQQLLVPAT